MEIEMLNINEAATVLRVHPETLRRFIREGKINAYKIGRRKLISKEGMEKFIKKCKGK